jgi:SAM-dependent methyltransferase
MNFYKNFEDNFRGSEKSVTERLRFYIPIINPLINLHNDPNVLDLGCGRGEWLALVKEHDFDGYGVDSNSEMIESCNLKRLKVYESNAIDYLQTLESNSFSVISSFHMIEHISFHDLVNLLKLCLRVLKPGGFLIMETPNPDNIRVATNNFYIDPTHLRPVPADLLKYLTTVAGFDKQIIIPMNEDKAILKKDRLTIVDILFGASPDYAVIAQKRGSDLLMSATEDFYTKSYGLTTHQLAEIYTNQIELEMQNFRKVNEKINRLTHLKIYRFLKYLYVKSGSFKNKFKLLS